MGTVGKKLCSFHGIKELKGGVNMGIPKAMKALVAIWQQRLSL